MAPALAQSASPMLLDFLFASIALAIGFVASKWVLYGPRTSHSPERVRKDSAAQPSDHVLMTIGKVRDLAAGVVHDVDTHSSEMGNISDEAKRLERSGSEEVAESVLALIGRAVMANQRLKARIASAEDRLRDQADELGSHRRASRTDFLTGLPNRRVFDGELTRRFDEWQRLKTPFSLMLVDLDHFKSLNDEYGREVGDKLLRRASDVLARTLRDMDVSCRYGGDEFAVVMPTTSLQDAQNAAERVRRAIEELPFAYQKLQLRVTASVGLSSVLPGDGSVNLLRRADHALHASKQSGGNCSHLHDGTASRRIASHVPSKSRFSTRTATTRRLQPELLFRLPGRGRFERVLTRCIADSHEHASPLSVMFLEVDGIAQVAADHGQPIADLILDEAAKRMQLVIRSTDKLFWDEEGPFSLILPGSTAAEAGMVAARIKASCLEAEKGVDGLDGPVSFRIGFASCQAEDDLKSLCERAELKMQCDSPTVLV